MYTIKVTEILFAYGHRNILANHRSTFEVTKEDFLSKKGDCIFAVASDKALLDLHADFKKSLRKKKAKIKILIKVEEIIEKITAFGHPKLILNHPTDIVVRKSNYICNRTLAIYANKSASDFSRKLVHKLKNPHQKVKIELIVTS